MIVPAFVPLGEARGVCQNPATSWFVHDSLWYELPVKVTMLRLMLVNEREPSGVPFGSLGDPPRNFGPIHP